MRYVTIELLTDNSGDRGGLAHMRVKLDGERFEQAEGVLGGGEPEDNTFGRDWNWVPYALKRLAEGLGATVTVTERKMTEEDEE